MSRLRTGFCEDTPALPNQDRVGYPSRSEPKGLPITTLGVCVAPTQSESVHAPHRTCFRWQLDVSQGRVCAHFDTEKAFTQAL